MTIISLAASGGHASLDVPWWEWAGVIGVVAVLIVLDLFVLNKKHEAPSVRTATAQTLMYVAVGAIFGLWMWYQHGGNAASLYYSTWLIEYSLSVDNVFVWSLILTFFAVPREFQHRLLFWGIFGALVMRFVFITLGTAVIHKFSWTVILLGLVLLWSAWKVFSSDDDDQDISETRLYRLATRALPVAEGNYGEKFVVRVTKNGKTRRMVTSMMICLIVVEGTDVLFAVDSVPAALAITTTAYIVFASNAMAILGLRALYFLFDSIKEMFSRLNEGLAIILAGVGAKLIVSSDTSVFGWFSMPGVHLPTWISLTFIAVVLAGSIIASKLWPEKSDDTTAGRKIDTAS